MRKWWKLIAAALLAFLSGVRGIADVIGEIQTLSDHAVLKWLVHPYFSLCVFVGAVIFLWWFYYDYRIRKAPAGFLGVPENKKRYRVQAILGALVVLAILIVALMVYGHFHRKATAHIQPPPSSPPPPSTPNSSPPIKRRRKPKNPTPCTMTTGTYYDSPLDMPGGPKLQRPMFYVEGSYENAWYWNGGDYLSLFEITVTNRGEESIVKNWELCFVLNGKPQSFPVGEIPKEGITLPTSEKITKEDSLPERLVRNSIPHGKSVTGWIAFSVSAEVMSKVWAGEKTPDGALRLQDYLSHKYSFDFIGSKDAPKSKVYVPGSAN